jgi:hypothetical protein
MIGMVIKAGMGALLLCLALSPASCTSDRSNGSAGVEVEQIETNIEHTISSDNLEVVRWLCQKNGLDLNNFEVDWFNIDPRCADNPEATYYGIRAIEIYEGLPVFLEKVGYGFNKDGMLVYRADRKSIHNASSDLSTEPTISKVQAAQKAADAYPGSFAGREMMAELGFHNRYVGMGRGAEYVLAWRITTGGEWPFAIVDASNGELLYYDDGIRY